MLTTAVLALLMPLVSVAQAPPRVARGVIVSLDHDTLTLKSQDGSSVRIALAPDWSVTLLKPIPVETIQPGSFVGTAEIPQLNGTGRSLEVHVFPPGVKVGEGHYGWDLRKGSMMSNGTVGKVTVGAHGRELIIAYPSGERKIVVPAGVPIVQFTSGDRPQIKPPCANVTHWTG